MLPISKHNPLRIKKCEYAKISELHDNLVQLNHGDQFTVINLDRIDEHEGSVEIITSDRRPDFLAEDCIDNGCEPILSE